jgi:colanic acid biosynthesis glycosyl transferase WcaI
VEPPAELGPGTARDLLIVSMYYWPEETGNAPYVTDLAEYLAAKGHRVTVLCGMPHYPHWRIAERYRRRVRFHEARAGVQIVRRWHYVPGRQSILGRAAYEGSFLLTAAGYRPRRRPDAVIGIVPSLSSGLMARLMAARARSAYGLIVQELMGAAAVETGMRGGAAASWLVSRAERWMMAHATVVAPVSRAFVPYLGRLGVSGQRVQLLPNWSRLGPASISYDEARQALGWRADEFVALHAGNMGLKQGLEQIIEAARLAEHRDAPLRFVLMGDGNQRQRLVKLAKGLVRLELRPFAEGGSVADVLGAADVLLVSERPSVRDMSLPSKLTSYFAAGRPVVAAVDPASATAEEIRRAGAGLAVAAGEPGALVDGLLQLRNDPQLRSAYAANGRSYARTSLSREAILAEADRLVRRVMERTAAIRGVAVT